MSNQDISTIIANEEAPTISQGAIETNSLIADGKIYVQQPR